jgi:hypothetical protein
MTSSLNVPDLFLTPLQSPSSFLLMRFRNVNLLHEEDPKEKVLTGTDTDTIL